MATQTSVITLGVLADKRSFKLKVENFDAVRHSPSFIEAQKFQFSAGESVGLPTSWLCYLKQNKEDKAIGIFFKLLEKPGGVEEVNVSFDVMVKRSDDSGTNYFHGKGLLKNMTSIVSWGFNKLVPANEELPLVDSALVIDIDFKLYAMREHPVILPDLSEKLRVFKTKSLEQLSKDLSDIGALATTPNANFVTKIISKDNVEFPANRGILAARSPVFQRMFATKMKEAETGEVRIDDLSGKALSILLGYIYAGCLHQDWKSAEVIQELTYAAHKYELGLLTEFLDGVLGSVCTTENGKSLLVLAKKLGMKKAEMELFAYVKNNATSVDDITVLVE